MVGANLTAGKPNSANLQNNNTRAEAASANLQTHTRSEAAKKLNVSERSVNAAPVRWGC